MPSSIAEYIKRCHHFKSDSRKPYFTGNAVYENPKLVYLNSISIEIGFTDQRLTLAISVSTGIKGTIRCIALLPADSNLVSGEEPGPSK
jgi:hypothetical protein